MIPARALEDHRPGIRRRAARLLAMVEAGRADAPAPVVPPQNGSGGDEVAGNAGRPSEAPVARLSASELRATLHSALADRSVEARGAFLDGLALALELGPAQVVAALEGVDVPPAPVRQDRKVAVSATVGDLLEPANAALPPQREPREMVIDSDHVAGVVAAPWIAKQPWHVWINSMGFAEDNPEGLRQKGPKAVGSALAGLAQLGQTAGRRDIREVAALVRIWLVEDAGRFDSLDRDLGLSPRDGRRPLSDVAKRAERDHLVILLSRQSPYSGLGAREAAKRLREARKKYEATRWPRDREERATRPVGEAETWWHVMRLGLARPMPDLERLEAMIEADRARDQIRLPLLS